MYTVANAQIPEIAEINDHDNVVTTLQFPSGNILMCYDRSATNELVLLN